MRKFGKRLKNLLWVESGGTCELCGVALDPDEFHADHEIPWKRKGPTTAHNGLALCPKCNLKKGINMLRKHQKEGKSIARSMRDFQLGAKNVLADVHPGGGKSALPAVFGHELLGSVADKICWIVPRLSLQQQAALSCQDKVLRSVIGHDFQIREATNDRDPCRGTAGFVTTYNAIGADSASTVADAFKNDRYLLVLDEPHHVEAGSIWHSKLQPLYDRAAARLFMTGTLTRGDRKPVAFLPYLKDGFVDLQHEDWNYISYTRTDALDEEAIIPMNFTFGNGDAVWYDIRSGQQKRASLEGADDEDSRAALTSALSGDYAVGMIDTALSDWHGYRRNVYRDALCLVVAPTQAHARDYANHISNQGVSCEIATSDEGEQAQERIKRFKRGQIPILVTVGMAYEGLDVKRITHLVGLTRFRSTPWLEQMFNRATRYNPAQGEWASQEAFVYVPADREMSSIVDSIRKEQDEAIREKDPSKGGGGGGEGGDTIVPLRSRFTGSKAEGLDDGLATNYSEESQVRGLMRDVGIEGQIATPKVLELIKRSQEKPERAEDCDMESTPKERELALRKTIEKLCRQRDNRLELPFGTTNKILIREFNKPRELMTEPELETVLQFLSSMDRAAS
jgi:superfamily II DNA or RNA helicase